jgi:hypothetical protein
MNEAVTFTTFHEMMAAFRARRMELGLSQLAVDERAGLATGYCGKLEAQLTNPHAPAARWIGKESLPLLLGALGLELAIASASRSPATTGQNAREIKEKGRVRFKTLAERGQKGGRIRWARMTDKQRATMIRKMNRARAEKRTKQATQKAATKRTRQAAEVVT